MKKKILCLIMAAVMTVGTAATAYAEDLKVIKTGRLILTETR